VKRPYWAWEQGNPGRRPIESRCHVVVSRLYNSRLTDEALHARARDVRKSP
jgi:hypothetical protein